MPAPITPINWNVETRDAMRAVADMFKGYTIDLESTMTPWGMSFEIRMSHGGSKAARQFKLDNREMEQDAGVGRKSLARELLKKASECAFQMWDPKGELKTISVKEVYAEVAHLTGEEHE